MAFSCCHTIFSKKRSELIENESSSPLYIEKTENFEEQIHRKLNMEQLINQSSNKRYRFVIRKLMLEDRAAGSGG
jgi:hypothetical protein